MGTGLRNSSNFKYALTKSSSSCTTDVISEGSFQGITDGSQVPLLTEKEYLLSEPDVYYLYIWLDAAESNNDTMDQSFHFTLGGSCTNAPIPESYYAYFGGSGQYFKTSPYKDNITSISIVNNKNMPEGAVNWNIGVSPSNVHGYVLGEHGDSEFIPWSNINVALQKVTDVIYF